MKNNFIYNFYLTLIFPIIGVVAGLRINNYKYQRAILIFGITLYGSTIVISEGNDGFEHRQNVIDHYTDLSFTQFSDELIAILSFAPLEGTNDDVYIHVLSYFLGGILGMPGLFFTIVAFIYGYFFSGSILKILKIIPQTKVSFIFYAFSIIFILQKNLEGINTVRTWTGLWVLFYASLSYFETKKLKYLFLMFVPPFIHVGYFIMALPAWFIAVFRSKFKMFYVGIFIISFFFGINQGNVLDNLGQTQLGEKKSEAYYSEEGEHEAQIEYRIESKKLTWYASMMKLGFNKIPVNLIIFSLIFGGIYFRGMTKLESNLFSIGILTKTLSNATGFLYALSSRSSLVGSVFVFAVLVLLLKRGYFQKGKIKHYYVYQIIFIVSLILLIPFAIWKVSMILYYISFFLLAFPFLPWFFNEVNFSIRELIEWFR